MKEKTLRYPGHAELMKIFRETGLFGKEAISVNGEKVIPLKVTTQLLFPKWKMQPGEEDFTIMSVVLEGETETITYTLLDYYDKSTNTTSMARTTGYTCTAVANLVLKKVFSRKGICPPEYIGEDAKCFESVLNYLKERKVTYKKEITTKKILTE